MFFSFFNRIIPADAAMAHSRNVPNFSDCQNHCIIQIWLNQALDVNWASASHLIWIKARRLICENPAAPARPPHLAFLTPLQFLRPWPSLHSIFHFWDHRPKEYLPPYPSVHLRLSPLEYTPDHGPPYIPFLRSSLLQNSFYLLWPPWSGKFMKGCQQDQIDNGKIWLHTKGWGLSAKLRKHSAIWGKLGTALQAYTLSPCTKFPPNPTSRKVNT